MIVIFLPFFILDPPHFTKCLNSSVDFPYLINTNPGSNIASISSNAFEAIYPESDNMLLELHSPHMVPNGTLQFEWQAEPFQETINATVPEEPDKTLAQCTVIINTIGEFENFMKLFP